MWAESMLENRVFKEVNSKSGEPFAEKVSRRPCCGSAAVLGAEGLHLLYLPRSTYRYVPKRLTDR